MMRPSLACLVAAVVAVAVCGVAAEDVPEPKSVSHDWDALKPVGEDAGLELRACDERVEQCKKRWEYFKATTDAIRKEYAKRGYVAMPKWQLGFVHEDAATARGETVSTRLTFIGDKMLDDPELELTSTLYHEGFHIVQNNSLKAMESTNEVTIRWAYESTASYMQYKLVPDSQLVKNRSIDFEPFDLETPFFGWNSKLHPYNTFNFWCYLDELYGAEDLLHLIFVNPAVGKPRQPIVPDIADALEYLLKERSDRKGRKRELADVLVEYIVRYGFKKDGEPLAAILAGDGADGRRSRVLQLMGQPREFKVGDVGRESQDMPYMEGKDRRKKKVFEEVQSMRWGIVKQYDIRSAMKDDEKGMLQLTVAGPPAKSRVLVFPRGKDGALQDPLLDTTRPPVDVDHWEKLAGALVVLIDVAGDENHRFTMTAEIKPQTNWNLAVTQQPTVGMLSTFMLKSIRLQPKQPLSEEESKKLDGEVVPDDPGGGRQAALHLRAVQERDRVHLAAVVAGETGPACVADHGDDGRGEGRRRRWGVGGDHGRQS